MHELMPAIFYRVMVRLVETGKVPKVLSEDPQMIGQYLHKILPGSNVYFLRCSEREKNVHYLKVGIAVNVAQRINSIQSSCPLKITKALYFYAGIGGRAKEAESAGIDALKPYKARGEWGYAESEREFEQMTTACVDAVSDVLHHPKMFTYQVGYKRKLCQHTQHVLEKAWQSVWDDYTNENKKRTNCI